MEKLEAIEDWFKLQKKYVDPQSKLHALACLLIKQILFNAMHLLYCKNGLYDDHPNFYFSCYN